MHTFALLVFAALAYVAQGAPSAQIVGSKDAPVGKYPYQVSIRFNGEHFCGGSILNNRNILTAAHCFEGIEKQLRSVTIHAGTNFLNESGNVHNVASITMHKYNNTNFRNNVALAHLSTPLTYTPKIQPIKLSTNDANREGKPCKMTGWGYQWNGESATNNLQEIDLIVFSQQQCNAIAKAGIVAGQICTFTRYEEGPCKGDSGGPLVGTDGLQIGIGSYVIGLCADGYPDVYTRVSSFLQWINAHLKK